MEPIINPEDPVCLDKLLGAVPVRNKSLVSERGSDGELVLVVPLRRKWYMRPPVSWLLRFSQVRRVSIDKIGREVWDACDGAATMEKIIDSFALRHHLTFHEARLSVMEFLRHLTRRGLVVLVGMRPEEATR